jgi:hypothetical protein
MNIYTRLYDWHREASYLGILGVTVRNALEVLQISVREDGRMKDSAYLVFREQGIADARQQHHADQERYHDSVRHGWVRPERMRMR